MNFQDLKAIIGQIKRSINCPHCNKPYTDRDLEWIGELSDMQAFFHSHCESCHTEAVINVTLDWGPIVHVQQEKPAKNPLRKKLPKSFPKEIVTVNEVLDIHNFLENFDGNFETLFTKKSQKIDS